MGKTWRQYASPIIARVIREVGTDDMKALRAALRAVYPFGMRQYHPYKVWCDEVRRQLGLKSPKTGKVGKTEAPDPRQMDLLNGD